MTQQFTSTSSSSLGGTVGSAGLVQKAYDRMIEFALRDEPLIRSVADKRPTDQTIPGSVVVMQLHPEMTKGLSVPQPPQRQNRNPTRSKR